MLDYSGIIRGFAQPVTLIPEPMRQSTNVGHLKLGPFNRSYIQCLILKHNIIP